jgi:hypothetical protein
VVYAYSVADTSRRLRPLLFLVAAAHIAAAILLFLRPLWVYGWFGVSALDSGHIALAAFSGGLLLVFAAAAVMAMIRPQSYQSVIVLLLLEHFTGFLVEVILVSRGFFQLIPFLLDASYMVLIIVGLIRFFPGRLKEAIIASPVPSDVGSSVSESASAPAKDNEEPHI